MRLRIRIVRNIAFEGPALIGEWATARGHSLTESLAVTEQYPRASDVDLLVVMGGPMDADDHDASPWLAAEKAFVRDVLGAGGRVLGVCLGAQVLAEVAGGRVKRNPVREIGWFPVRATEAGRRDPRFAAFDGAVVGHWHGDTFDLPAGVDPLLSSDATSNQAFVTADGRGVGLQFHVEWTEESLAELVRGCEDELCEGGPYVMSGEEMLAHATRHIGTCRRLLFTLLDSLQGRP